MHDIHLSLNAAGEKVRASAIAERFMAGESGTRIDDEVNASSRRGRGGSRSIRCRLADPGAGSLHARSTRRVRTRRASPKYLEGGVAVTSRLPLCTSTSTMRSDAAVAVPLSQWCTMNARDQASFSAD